MKIGVLTSSRADYGIYRPLLKAISNEITFELSIIVFGTHLSKKHGYTINQIIDDGYTISAKIDTMPESDCAIDISKAMGKTIIALSELWENHDYDIVFALGDRYEMFAAVTSTLPYNVKIAHIHGGETTLGAIDNTLRNCLTSMAYFHFTATEIYKQRVIEIVGNDELIFNVGALSIDNIEKMKLLSIKEFNEKFNINLSLPTILITFHPETVCYERNKEYIIELIEVLQTLSHYQLVITMPNADTMSNYIRENLCNFIEKTENAIGVENFGSLGYLSCMKHCRFLLGNSSSGFIEAAGMNKAVINIGDRQKGRIITPNIFSVPIIKEKIILAIENAENFIPLNNEKIYGDGNAASRIVQILKNN